MSGCMFKSIKPWFGKEHLCPESGYNFSCSCWLRFGSCPKTKRFTISIIIWSDHHTRLFKGQPEISCKAQQSTPALYTVQKLLFRPVVRCISPKQCWWLCTHKKPTKGCGRSQWTPAADLGKDGKSGM